MNGKLEATALDIALRLMLGYEIEVVENKSMIGAEGNSIDKIIATSPEGKVIWYLFSSYKSAQQTFDRVTKLVELYGV